MLAAIWRYPVSFGCTPLFGGYPQRSTAATPNRSPCFEWRLVKSSWPWREVRHPHPRLGSSPHGHRMVAARVCCRRHCPATCLVFAQTAFDFESMRIKRLCQNDVVEVDSRFEIWHCVNDGRQRQLKLFRYACGRDQQACNPRQQRMLDEPTAIDVLHRLHPSRNQMPVFATNSFTRLLSVALHPYRRARTVREPVRPEPP